MKSNILMFVPDPRLIGLIATSAAASAWSRTSEFTDPRTVTFPGTSSGASSSVHPPATTNRTSESAGASFSQTNRPASAFGA